MSTWRVHRHYGHGAAQVPLRAEAHRGSSSAWEGVATLLGELVAGGPIAATRRLASQAPAIGLGFLLLMAFLVTLTRDHSDTSDIEVVMFQTPTEELLEQLPLPPIEVA